MQTKTYREIAESYSLWQTYVDPGAFGTEEEFENMTIEARIALIENCFGPEDEQEDA